MAQSYLLNFQKLASTYRTNSYFPVVKTDRYQHMSDQELLSRFYEDHNNEWLGALLQRYTLLLLGVSMKYLKNEEEAKDNVQQIFLKVIQELQKYKVEFFKSWLYIVAKNHCLMRLREKQGKITAELSERLSTKAGEETDWVVITENEQALVLMESSLTELNPEQKQCLTLFYLQKKSYQQVSDETGYNMLQVKSYIQNGKRNLRLLIEKKLAAAANRK